MIEFFPDDFAEKALRKYVILRKEKRTPEEWLQAEKYKGLVIMDPDGWRGKDAPAWDEPITEDEFNHRLCMSTVLQARVYEQRTKS